MTQRPLQVPRWVYPRLAVATSNHFIWADFPNFLRQVSYQYSFTGVGHRWSTDNPASTKCQHCDKTPQTHELTEAWIREHATPGTVVLLGQGWLDLSQTQIVPRRVPDLRAALDKGIAQLGGCDWVVVPEPVLGHPHLRQLGFLLRVDADRSFGGNLGLDYEVYAVPDPISGTICGSGRAR